jgi:hypothetical protein
MVVMLMQELAEEQLGELMLRKGQFLQVIKDVIMRLQYKGRQQKVESAPQDALYVVLSLIQKTKPPKLPRQPSTVQYAWSVCAQRG